MSIQPKAVKKSGLLAFSKIKNSFLHFVFFLQFALALMVLHPEVQERVHEELDRVVEGRDHVTMEDRARLPYVEATLNEIWRYCNVAPFGPPRRGRSLFLHRTLKRLSHEK